MTHTEMLKKILDAYREIPTLSNEPMIAKQQRIHWQEKLIKAIEDADDHFTEVGEEPPEVEDSPDPEIKWSK